MTYYNEKVTDQDVKPQGKELITVLYRDGDLDVGTKLITRAKLAKLMHWNSGTIVTGSNGFFVINL